MCAPYGTPISDERWFRSATAGGYQRGGGAERGVTRRPAGGAGRGWGPASRSCRACGVETYSVLTRLPGSSRRTPVTGGRLLAANFPHTRFLSPGATALLLARLAEEGVSGGAVYDALVGAAAVEHRLPLLTRDGRALRTYRALDVEVIAI